MGIHRTGYKKYSTLVEYNQITGLPTGRTKPNVIGDPDYIPPILDESACPPGITTTTTIAPPTTTTTTFIQVSDNLIIHVAYLCNVFPNISYTNFNVSLMVKTGSYVYFSGNVSWPLYASGNSIIANSTTRGLVDIIINSIVYQANWMRVLYSSINYPNPPISGIVLYNGPVQNLSGLSVPSNMDNSADILVIEFSTTPAVATTTTVPSSTTTTTTPSSTTTTTVFVGEYLVVRYKNLGIKTASFKPYVAANPINVSVGVYSQILPLLALSGGVTFTDVQKIHTSTLTRVQYIPWNNTNVFAEYPVNVEVYYSIDNGVTFSLLHSQLLTSGQIVNTMTLPTPYSGINGNVNIIEIRIFRY